MQYKIHTTLKDPLKLKQKKYYKIIKKDDEFINISYSIVNYINLNHNDSFYYPYRSLIIAVPENQVLVFSPQKSISFQQFSRNNPYLHNDIVINEWIEGVMINLFFDKRRESWEISTKYSIGGNYAYNPQNALSTTCFNTKGTSAISSTKTYYQMFLEALLENTTKKLNDIVIFNDFPKDFCYSFVLQHPDIHIVLNNLKPRLYLVSIFEIDVAQGLDVTNTITYISPNVYEKWDIFDNIEGIIHFPKRYDLEFDCYMEIVEKMTDLRTNMNIVGVVLTNVNTGERTKVENKTYEKISSCVKFSPVNQYQYLCLYKVKKVDEFLVKYPYYKNTFEKYELEYTHFITNLHNLYFKVFIDKSLRKCDISKKYASHIHKLHYEIYIPMLATGEIKKINKTVIREYFGNYEPHQQLYYLNYLRREHVFNMIS